MTRPLPLLLDRFRHLARVGREVWQGGVVSVPAWVDGPDAVPTRPQGILWVSSETGRVHYAPLDPGSAPFEVAVGALVEFGLDRRGADCRPARIEVTDADLAATLRTTIADPELTVAVVDDLPGVRAVLRQLDQGLNERVPLPDVLDGEGVTVAEVRAFAEAARAFYDAAPWRHLSNDDVVRIEAPVVDAELTHAVVMGEGGIVHGLSFYTSIDDRESVHDPKRRRAFEARGHWAVLFGPPWELPFGDLDLFEAHALPVAGPQAYPLAARLGVEESVERPDATKLAWLEGLLRVLAATTEDELDAGRWSREVTTARGPALYTLTLPDLLEPPARPERPPSPHRARRAMERVLAEMERVARDENPETIEDLNRLFQERFAGRSFDDIPSTASTPLERAEDLMYEAFEARGRRQIQLARRALALSPDCADAYVILAERAWDVNEQVRLYSDGVAAGERALGREFFDEHAGRFWGLVEARPYLRARSGLAQALDASGRVAEATEHYREILRLDEEDHQGVRYLLLSLLLREGADDEVGSLLERFGDEPTALSRYRQVLSTWRRGDRREAQRLLRRAIRANPLVPAYLTGRRELPDEPVETYTIGSPGEAVLCAEELGPAWQRAPGALDWLAAETRRRTPPRRRGSKRSRRS